MSRSRRLRLDSAAGHAALPALALVCVSLVGTALADQITPLAGGWSHYVNDRYGTTVDYPAGFKAQEAPTNGDGRRFASADATIEIYSWHDADGESAASLRKRLNGSEGYTDVTYSPAGKDWFVLSGYRGKNIFYEKYFFRSGVVSGFGMEFPRSRKPHYAPMVERMENSFRAGKSD